MACAPRPLKDLYRPHWPELDRVKNDDFFVIDSIKMTAVRRKLLLYRSSIQSIHMQADPYYWIFFSELLSAIIQRAAVTVK